MATATTTVANIISLVQEDLMELFTSSGSTSVLIEYCNRIQAMILGRRPQGWNWMVSAPQRFITERGQTDYWIGATGSVSAGQVNTALNLSDVRRVVNGSVISRSGFANLYQVAEAPAWSGWQNEDASYDEGVPHSYRNDEGTPNVISIYPAPDEGSTYELIPPAPHSTTATGGALSARTYYIRTTFVDLEGNEGEPSSTARQFVEASKLITVKAPQPKINAGSAGVSYLRYNVYASTTEGSETLQNVSPTATSTDWTEDASGLTTSGASVPTSSDLEPLRGYVIEFRYYKAHTAITATADILLIPNEFRDVVVAGVNMLASKYLGNTNPAADIAYWQGLYQAGIDRMVLDQNPWPGGARYIKPDPASFTPLLGGGGMNWWSPDR